MSAVRPETQVAIARLRDELAELARGAVDLSERVAETELFVLAPADAATPGELVLCDLRGDVVPDTPGAEHWSAVARVHAALYAAHPTVRAIARSGSEDAPVYTAGSGARAALAARPESSRAD